MSPAAVVPASVRVAAESGFSTHRRRLHRAARAWTAMSLIGQAIFSTYIALLYGGAVVAGDLTRWNRVMPKGYVAGDGPGNVAIGIHLAIAVLVLVAGGLQVVPTVRARVPALHRWVGRLYVLALCLTTPVGLYLVWVRGSVGDLSQHLAISANALIMGTCAVLAWRTARARDYAAHRRWALRAWLAASGVFFFRLALFLWLLVFRAPVGFDPETFSGPLLTILAIGTYVVVPLSVLQAYFAAEASTQVGRIRAVTAALWVITVLTVAGIVSVSLIVWVPRMRG